MMVATLSIIIALMSDLLDDNDNDGNDYGDIVNEYSFQVEQKEFSVY